MNFQMCPQLTCLSRCVIALVAFVQFHPRMHFQIISQSICPFEHFFERSKEQIYSEKALKLRQNLPLVVWAKLRYDFENFSAIPQTSACAFYLSSYMFTSMQWSSEEEMGVPWSLYAAHTLSTWGDNMWWFAGRHLDLKIMDTLFVHLHPMLESSLCYYAYCYLYMALRMKVSRWLLHVGAAPLLFASHRHLRSCHRCFRWGRHRHQVENCNYFK